MNKTMRQVLIILIIKLDMKTKSINLLIISKRIFQGAQYMATNNQYSTNNNVNNNDTIKS